MKAPPALPARTAAQIPIIQTERLVLRGPRRDDFAAFAAMWADPEVVRYIGGEPFGRERAWQKFLRNVGHWALMGYGYWVVEEAASGASIGQVGFANLERDVDPPIGESPEIGWVLATSAAGRGYATEASRAAVEWGEAHFGGASTACIIDPRNTASIRVADKLGYRQVATASYLGDPVLLLRRP